MPADICPRCGGTVLDFHESGLCWRCAEADPSVGVDRLHPNCAKCNEPYGAAPERIVRGAPYCKQCFNMVYGHPYPGWLRQSFVAALVLLGVGLVHDLPYFKLEREFLLGERALNRGNYGEAATKLTHIVSAVPGEKPRLLAANALLHRGDYHSAWELVKDREFEDKDLLSANQVYFDKVDRAGELFEQAEKAEDAGHYEEAQRAISEGMAVYPEATHIQADGWHLRANLAFDQKDYQAFLDASQKALAYDPEDPARIATVSGAYAALYAKTGAESDRQRSEQLLAEAQNRAVSDDDRKDFEEYAERIRYRLASRVIIDKDEYDRRFRKTSAGGSH
jgi:tetratricopeptide (TPR) repeat protein